MNRVKEVSALLSVIFCLVGAGLTLHGAAERQPGEQPPTASEVTPDPWPKAIEVGGAKYSIYQPQVDSWDGYFFQAHAAVSVLPAGSKDQDFGMIEILATTLVDRVARSVTFEDIQVRRTTFVNVPDKDAEYQKVFQSMLAGGPSTMSLDRLQAALAIEGAEKKAGAVPVLNNPPEFIFSEKAAILVAIAGDPVWGTMKGSLDRVINTRALVLRDSKQDCYIHIFDGFVEAPSLHGPWKVATQVPRDANKIAAELAKQNVVDLMEETASEVTSNQKPSLKNGPPQVFVVSEPTELIVTNGTPDWVPISGTQLLYVNNTTANIFKDLNSQKTYILVTGRWFTAPGLSGPWQYVPGQDLPADFAKIPDDSSKENVKASVPGTPQAQEAVIAAGIPQMATVYRNKVTFTPQVSGTPEIKPIPDTTLQYVFNSPDPIVEVTPTQWYAVQKAVWFTASSWQGPWVVATSVPAVIYSMPPSSPIYYVTYVRVYSSTPETVVVGYTPGYMGTIITGSGVVVYGTGYTYLPYVGATVYYPPPATYGYAVNITYTPYTGWAFGFGFGWGWGAATFAYTTAWGYGCAPYWCAMPYYGGYYRAGYAYGPYGGAAAWGPGGWAATSGNIYHHYGETSAVTRSSAGYNAWTGNAWSSQVGHSYNSVTGRVSAGQSAAVQNVYTGGYSHGNRGATYNPSTGVGAAGSRATVGNVYTGQQATVARGEITGPTGNTAHLAQVNNDYYADRNGNVYRYNFGSGFQQYNNGSWNSVQGPETTQSLQSQLSARQRGDARSASSSWSGNWGSNWKGATGSSGWNHGSLGGGGWDRGSWGGGRSWGGRGWGGGGWGGFRGRR
jgi:hypothetical protein